MTYYRMGMRLKMSRAVARAMSRTGNKHTTATIEQMIQTSKNRFGSTIGRPLAAAIVTSMDTGMVFHSAEYLFFNDGEDDDGTTTSSTADLPRVSTHFPRVPAGCEKVSDTFFSCFYEHGKQPTGQQDAEIGNRALETCKASLDAYNACVDAAMEKVPKKLFRVPEAYRVRE